MQHLDISDRILKEYIRKLINKRKVYIWGAWVLGKLLENYLQEFLNISIEAYVDSNPNKQNTSYHNKPVKNPSDIQKEAFIFISIKEYPSVRSILAKHGYIEYRDYLYCGKQTCIMRACNYEDMLGNRLMGSVAGHSVTMTFHDRLFIGQNVTIGENTRINLGGFSEIIIEDNVSIGSNVIVGASHGSRMIIGRGVKIGGNAYFSSSMESSLIIGSSTSFMMRCSLFADNHTRFECGRDCMFSHDILAHSSDGNSHVILKNGIASFDKPKNIQISDHVWIGMGARILPGTQIGTGSIVGAASLVNKSFGEHVSIAGTPAKVVSENVDWQR